MEEPGHVHKKASSDILFAEYGFNYEDGEDPTQENRRVIDLYDPVDAMSLNREKDRVVVAGIRGVLQVIKIQNSNTDVNEGPSIIKDLDMRAYRKGKVNILYSAQNVKWNQIYDQYIATTSSNGSIVCWNINRKNKSVYKSHERSATCLDWHSTAPYILVSGSRDCAVKSYDLRAKDIHQLTFCDRVCESVRDVTMCKAPGFDDYFFSGDDGGVLRLWDLRQTKRCVFQKVAHRSFVSTLSLNPNNRTLIATGGGRDKLVKVWEWTGPEIKRISVIETTAPLGRVVWRPDKPYQIATCASVNETTVHVWDVRRPYLPCVTYDEHYDSVTDACWPNNDFEVFLSCGKDGLIVVHNIDSGHAPLSYACDGAFDITPDGIMAVAVNSEVHARNDAEMEAKAASSKEKAEKKTLRKVPYEEFSKPVKSLIGFGIPESLTYSLPPNTFYAIAEKYLIGGMDIMSLCEINSKISRKAGMEHVAQTWKLVEALCAQARIQEEYDKMSADEKKRIIRAWIVRKKELAEEGRRWLANVDDVRRADVKKIVKERLENTQHVTAFLNFSSGSDSDNNSDKELEIKDQKERTKKEKQIPERERELQKEKRNAFTDFYFGGGESNFNEISEKKELLHLNEFMGLRNEAFDIRDDVTEAKFFCRARKQPTTAEEYEKDIKKAEAEFKAWSPMLEIYRLLQYHAEQGDMQTCATVSMVCGKRLFDAVDQYTVNGWIMCYMEMLDKLELFLVCAKIRKYCPLESINSVSRQNTTIQLLHLKCGAIIVNGRCSKCEKPAQSDCTVCKTPIIGLTYQCNVCGHAMHCDHAYEWFQRTSECAYVGCPCICGQNSWPDMERTFISNDDNPRPHRKFVREAITNQKISNVEASRLDSDSDENTEIIPGFSEKIDAELEKLGLMNPREEMPWAKHLVKLYTTRTKKRPFDRVIEKRRSDEEERPKKEHEKDRLRTLLSDNFKENQDRVLDLINTIRSSGDSSRRVISDKVVDHYLDPPEEESEEQVVKRNTFHRRSRLEEIIEEDEDYVVEYEEEGLRWQPRSQTVSNEISSHEGMFENGVCHYEESYVPNCSRQISNMWNEKFSEDVEMSNGNFLNPNIISEKNEEIFEDDNYSEETSVDEEDDVYEEEEEYEVETDGENGHIYKYQENGDVQDLETFSPAERINGNMESASKLLRRLPAAEPRRLMILKDGDPNMPKKSERTIKDRVLAVLSMSKKDMQKKRAKRRYKQQLRVLQGRADPFGSSQSSEDEYAVTSDDSVSFESTTSSSSSDGSLSDLFIPVGTSATQADCEESLPSATVPVSTSNEELNGLRECGSTPNVTGDLYEKTASPVPRVVHRVVDHLQVSGSLSYLSEEVETTGTVFIGVSGVSPSSSSSAVSTPVVSPTPSLPSFSTAPVFEPPLLPPLPSYPSQNKLFVFKESPPSTPEVPEPPLTSCSNSTFLHISQRPPLSNPVQIEKKGHSSDRRDCSQTSLSSLFRSTENVHSATAQISAANPLFPQCSTSLPMQNYVPVRRKRYNTVLTASEFDYGNWHRSPRLNGFLSSEVIENDASRAQSSWGSKTNVNHHALAGSVDEIEDPPEALLVADPTLPESPTKSSEAVPVPSSSKKHIGVESFPDFPDDCLNLFEKDFLQQKYLEMQAHSEKEEDSDSILFSSDDDSSDRSPECFDAFFDEEHDEEPFFPQIKDVPFSKSSNIHPWETEEQYQQRLRQEEEEEAAERAEQEFGSRSSDEDDEGKHPDEFFAYGPSPMQRELERLRKQRDKVSPKPDVIEKYKATLSRVKFDEKKHSEAMDIALKKLKETEMAITGNVKGTEAEELKAKEAEVCLRCKHEMKSDKQERDYVQWIRKSADEGQLFLGNSIYEPCSVFQLAYLDEYLTDAEEVKQIEATFVEFVKLFYFIQWEKLMRPDNEIMLKEVYQLWDDYRKKRHRVCKEHYRDFHFRFFTSSIAVKIKKTLFSMESLQARQEATTLDWAHLKPCVVALDATTEDLDRLLEREDVKVNPEWTPNEKTAARKYWDLFGTVPLQIVSKENVALSPDSVDCLEIIDDTNYWTKKMLRAVMYHRRNFDIKLSYTKKKKRDEMFLVQHRTEQVLQKRWKTRLDRMINENPKFDFESSTLRIRAMDSMIHTEDAHSPFPVCQIEDGNNLVTIRPVATRRFFELKSRVRAKFSFARQAPCSRKSRDFHFTSEDIRKTQSYKRFEPKLKKGEELTKMLSKHFKMVDRQEVIRRYKLHTIVEEDEEVSLIVSLLERQKQTAEGRNVLDPEDIFADRQHMRQQKETAILAKMEEERFRKALANTKKMDCAKMSMMNNHWMPQFKRTFRKAQKAIQLGSILVDEEIQKWMEYQYQLSFAKKQLKQKSLITKAEMKCNVPPKWRNAVDQLDFDEPTFPPPYHSLPEKSPSEPASPSLPSFNSSSEDEDGDGIPEAPKKIADYAKCVDLIAVAGKLQDEAEQRIAMADKDDDWQYSDDSSVSTWFDDGCDDIMNRLINVDYVDEHLVLRERSKGALANKLWKVFEERQEELCETDEEEDGQRERIERETEIEEDSKDAKYLDECESFGDFGNVGVPNGKKKQDLAQKEKDMDLRRYDKKEMRNLEMQQLRYYFRQYKLDHSYMTEPFNWDAAFHEPIVSLHRNELRRVGNRAHRQMKEDYEAMVAQDNIIVNQFPADESSLHNKMFNYLMFGASGESFEAVSKNVDETNQMLKPLKEYEMFFGKEGVFQLKKIKNEIMQCTNIRSSIKYLCREFGDKMRVPKEKLIAFLKLWWINSAQTLESFLRVCEESYNVDERITDHLAVWDQLPQHVEIVRETIDQLEIGLMVNDIIYVVEQYVDETEALYKCAVLPEDRIAFATMDVWDWHEIKYGYPCLYDDLGEARAKLLQTESEDSSEEIDECIGNVFGTVVISQEEEDEEHTVSLSSSENEVSPIRLLNQEPSRKLSLPAASIEMLDRLEPDPMSLHQQLISHYKAVYKELQLAEAEKKERRAEENARKLLEEWEYYEDDQTWEADDLGRKIHDFLTMEMAVRESTRVVENLKEGDEEHYKVSEKWEDELEKIKSGAIEEPQAALYAKEGIDRCEILEMCGLPLSLDHEMFMAEMQVCQSASTSISDASEMADAIEEGFEDDDYEIPNAEIDEDAQSYSSARHVYKFELYFQRDVQSRQVPSCVVIFSPEQFFEDYVEFDLNFKKWRRIIEASDGPFSFNKLVMRERLLRKCRDEFRFGLIENYLDVEERSSSKILQVFHHCLILVVVDTKLNPWTCRVVSRKSLARPAIDRKTYIRKKIIEDSQKSLIDWLKKYKVDMEVYSRCPVIVDRGGSLSLEHADQMSHIFIEDEIREEWLSIKRDEGVCALDAIIKMPPPPKEKLAGYKAIFKPIYEAWYPTWKFENDRSGTKILMKPKPDRVKDYIYKTKIIVNYAHQHYRMKKYDSFLAKDPTAYHTVERADVPSASLFDSLDTAVTKFCNEDSPHLSANDKKVLRDSLIQLATGKIPYFTTNYFGAEDYTEDHATLSDRDEENDDASPLRLLSGVGPLANSPNSKVNPGNVEAEYNWLRSMYEESDMDRRRFMARLLFEIAQKSMFRFAPHLANFDGAKKKFEHLLTLHAKQRPLLDMMLTKVRGTYFMPLETNMFLYKHKLLTFGELIESEVHPKDMRHQKFSLEKNRRQEPKTPQQMNNFLDGLAIETDSADSGGSDISSEPSSTLGSMESLDLLTKKRKRRARRNAAKLQREEMLLKLRSKPNDPDESFVIEKRALGPKMWKTRRKINNMLEGIADLDRNNIKLPTNKKDLLDHVNKLIIENSETAHWSWGDLQMRTRINCIPPVHRMKQKHIEKIKKGLKMYQPPKKYDSNSKKEDGRKWF